MAGIVVVAHHSLAAELIRAAQHVMGRPEPGLVGVDVSPEAPYEESRDRVRAAVAAVADEGCAVIATDMYGGTPSNLAMELMEPGRVEVLSGVNLPMLVRLLTYRDRPLEEQVQKGVDGGREGVILGRGQLMGWPS
jgi:mannose/fructose-specific phosphotransferase system component IIA